jgi:transposase-like protein
VSVARASRDLDVHESVLRKWVKEFSERFLRRMIKILREEAPGNKL